MEQQKVDLDALEVALMELRLDEQKALWAKLEMKRQEIRWDLIPALIAELRELRAREAHMRRFAESMAKDGHPILMGFAYQVQVILDTRTLPMSPTPEANHGTEN